MRVVIADDEALLREGLRALLTEAGMEVVGTAVNAEELLKVVALTDPELVITDIRMSADHNDEGLRAALEIRAASPTRGVVVLSQHVQRQYAMQLLADNSAGVGYLLKQRVSDVATFCSDVVRVGAGGTVLDPEVVDIMLNRSSLANDKLDRLTERQRQVLALIAEGRSNTAIAARLNVTEKAIIQHASHIYKVLGLPADTDDHRRVLAVLHYLNR
jgi:DNA-binding NarL/FixJ family response regulator